MPVHLEEGLVLGELHQLDIVPEYRAKKLSVELMLDELQALHPVPHQTPDDKPSTLRPTLMSKEHGDRVLDALDIKCETLSSTEEAAMQALVREYANVFALDSSELGATDLVQHVINTGEHPPICQPALRILFALRDKVERLVNDMLEQSVVVPSKSPWGSLAVLVAERDETVRFCVA